MQFSLSHQSKQTKGQFQMNPFYQRRLSVRNGSIEGVMLMFPKLCPIESIHVWIPDSIEILEFNLFKNYRKLFSISFECNSRLTRIESYAFYNSSLQSIMIPSTVQILGSSCFSSCKSLSSISFESNSQLTRIESNAFSNSSLSFHTVHFHHHQPAMETGSDSPQMFL
jgi:hypothetical protein